MTSNSWSGNMPRIVLDPQASEKLAGVRGIVEICDTNGHLLGMYAAGGELKSLLKLEPQISQEELDRRGREGHYVTSADIRARLKGG